MTKKVTETNFDSVVLVVDVDVEDPGSSPERQNPAAFRRIIPEQENSASMSLPQKPVKNILSFILAKVLSQALPKCVRYISGSVHLSTALYLHYIIQQIEHKIQASVLLNLCCYGYLAFSCLLVAPLNSQLT